jgi:hypothetical protein
MRHHRFSQLALRTRPQGYSLVELLVSVVILMAMLFQFMAANQKTYMSQQLQSEVSQGPRSAFEIIGQELNQAGYNAPFVQSRTLASAASASGSAIVDITMSGGGVTPITRGIFYGTRLIIGNTCTTSGSPAVTTCDQEEVPVTSKTSYSLAGTTRAITAKTVPVVLTNDHAAGETIYSRNYPFPTGVYYDNRTAAATPIGIADNKIKFYGDILGTGDLYYGEYRLEKYDSASGTYTAACSNSASSTGPFVLTRYLARLADPSTGIFQIPANKASAVDPRGNTLNVAPLSNDDSGQPAYTVSPLVDHIQGTCAPSGWTYTAPDATSPTGSTAVSPAISYTTGSAVNVAPLLNPDGTPAIWLKMYTFGAYDSTTSTAYFQSFVVDVEIALTVQRSQTAAQGGAVSTQRLQTRIVPRNIWDALTIAQGGGSSLLPQTPLDPATGYKLPLN